MESTERVLILYVDKDGDVSRATKIPTPIIGREKNFEAAKSFALLSPEDSDLNALFYAIKIYDELSKNKVFKECQIATISGQEKEGLESDIKIKKELEQVLREFKADGVVFISDGGRDELVIPLITSMIPIISVKRVIVGQSESVEETFLLLSKYTKKIMKEPQLRQVMIGLPGILLILYALFTLLNLVHLFALAILLLIGITAFVKGFSIDVLVKNSWSKSKLQFVGSFMSLSLALFAIYSSIVHINEISSGPLTFLQLVGEFMLAPFAYNLNTIMIITISIMIFFSIRALEHFLDSKPVMQDLIAIFFSFSMGIILMYLGYAFTLSTFDFKIFGVNALFLVLALLFSNIVIIIISRIYE